MISFAVISLLLIQLYWIDNAIKLKENEFNRIVSKTLKDVVSEVEKLEALSKLRSHQQGKFLFYDIDIDTVA